GAARWGPSPVNGVATSITEREGDTQGLLLYGGGGTEEQGFTGARYGVKINDDAFVRIYAKYFNRDSSVLPDDTDAHDSWDMFRAGFRLDWDPTHQDSVTVQGDIYTGQQDEVYAVPTTT